MTEYCRADFGDDFAWGVASAAYQIEGAWNKDGKGPSIWDEFTRLKGKIRNGEDGRNACDFYHRFHRDLLLMSQMNIRKFRFSISWSRLFPKGTGQINRAGLDYYNQLVDFCLELDIEPWVTIYHWDLPAELEHKGGWTNRDMLTWFEEYAATCIRHFGDRVKNWMIMNEPMVFTGAGYFLGVHAPGRRGLTNFLKATHHAALCQAIGGRVARSLRPDLFIGTTFSTTHIEPFDRSNIDDLLAAKRIDVLANRLFIEPLLGMGYPLDDMPVLKRIENFMEAGDEKLLRFNMDFVGVQNYTRELVTHSYLTPYARAKVVKANLRKVPSTTMNWEVYPEAIYHALKKFSAYPNIPPIIVTENGAAFPDLVTNGEVPDINRRNYLQNYLGQVLRAKNEGVDVRGYFVWSFTDNFEWAEGYEARFGLVHIDYATQKRIIKSSGKWYSNFLREVESINKLRAV